MIYKGKNHICLFLADFFMLHLAGLFREERVFLLLVRRMATRTSAVFRPVFLYSQDFFLTMASSVKNRVKS